MAAILVVRSNCKHVLCEVVKMDCKDNNNMDQLASVSGNSVKEGNRSWDELYEIDKEIKNVRSKLLECENEHECREMEMCDVNQLKDKGNFILKDVEIRYKDLYEQLKKIHYNYVYCAEKLRSSIEIINSLTLQRDKLKKELEEYMKMWAENSKKLLKIKEKITIQEKMNTALIRKLKRTVENVCITPDLRDRVNTILNDPRNVETKNSNPPKG